MTFKQIREGKFTKIIVSYLAIQIMLQFTGSNQLFALTGGPSQPEFNSFTPIGTSDMVNLSSGDFNYNIPVMDVGGYPLNLAYNSGVTMDQEASWVGLGWNLSVGQINRQVRGIPDDFNGDEIVYENNLKKNKTTGMTFFINGQFFGAETGNASGESSNSPSINAALTVEHNNYEGISTTPSLGFAFNVGGAASVGMNLSSSATEGVSVSPSIGISKKMKGLDDSSIDAFSANLGAGMTYNSRQGLTAFSINTSLDAITTKEVYNKYDEKMQTDASSASVGSTGGRVSYVNHTFTPAKRTQFHNTAFTFDASVGADFWGIDGELGLTAFGVQQKLKTKYVTERAFGYEFTKNATTNDILDFNRENDGIVSKNTLVLPTVNYTYDMYSIQGQGTGGQFRPYKSQVGYVYDQYVQDSNGNGQLGVEIEGATGFHVGVDLKYTNINNHTGVWNTPAKHNFENSINNDLDYEETYFKSTGDLSVDPDLALFNNEGASNHLGGENPIALDILPNNIRSYGKYATNVYVEKKYVNNQASYGNIPITQNLKRENRENRNQAIQKINKEDALNDPFINANSELKNHHTNGIKITNSDGAIYVYGDAAVNTSKKEVTFNVGDNSPNYATGTVGISGADSPSNSLGLDNYFNRITTPQYAHSYLLSSVLSADYEDLTGNGASDDDLGAYTKFHYNNFTNDEVDAANNNLNVTSVASNYKWRVPYGDNIASYNPGLNTLTGDQKGSYTEGTKALKYATMIETKTHVAIFDFTKREDGKSNSGQSQLAIKTIKLYSKPEAIAANLLDNNPNNNAEIAPIKTAHFDYNYSLMPGNPSGYSTASSNGKLTLEKVYFTYRDSKMGKYTPYVFNYDNANPSYQMKSYDVWGNYKPLYDSNNPVVNNCQAQNDLTASEFPFVQQENKALQDSYVSAWTLSSINLPSGGKIDLQYESDDYQYVQDLKAMQMFKVVGVSSSEITSVNNVMGTLAEGSLYYGNEESKYIIVELPNENLTNVANLQGGAFKENYLGEHYDKPIYFNFLANMTKTGSCSYDYVSGYFEIDKNTEFKIFPEHINGTDKVFASIPMKHIQMEGGSRYVNPISQAGWWFGRKNLNRFVYGVGDNTPENASLEDIVDALGAAFGGFIDIFRAPNIPLRNGQQIARKFIPNKSWIRLQHGSKAKLGGGLRVKQIKMFDNWDKMTDNEGNLAYSNFYGQDYNYKLDNQKGSSGVATWEPNVSRENPFIEPFYNNPSKLMGPKEVNYAEKPFGKSFFPAPAVTYSKVTVSNLERTSNGILKKHATGKVVNEFYTFKNFPTIADFTTIDDPVNYKDNLQDLGNSLLSGLIGISRAKTELALSQGFTVVTNDMNGKSKSQKVYDENNKLISGVDYNYFTNLETGRLNNQLPVIDKNGDIKTSLIGTQYDVINDFRESYNRTVTRGISGNISGFTIAMFPVIIPLGLYSQQDVESTLHTTTTTKVIHKSGILKEKIAYDLGSSVSTRNLAWDAISGQVLLTETINEYDDNYYNFTYPAHWQYKGMGQAIKNLGIEAWLSPIAASASSPDASGDEEGATSWFKLRDFTVNLNDFFAPGDEVYSNTNGDKYWINEINPSGNAMILINRDGSVFNACGESENDINIRVVRSHERNVQSASMASVTSMTNPLIYDSTNQSTGIFNHNAFNYDGNINSNDPKIINASAVQYKDYWRPQKEANLPNYPQSYLVNDLIAFPQYGTNPFVNNIKGDWRAVESYAYLTGRTSPELNRNSGFFTNFKPFSTYNIATGNWQTNADAFTEPNIWTSASQVTKYSPYGAELENKDALNRHSAAQYGYNYSLPTAVASNSEYREMGYDGFEDYASTQNGGNDHFSFRNNTSNRTSTKAHTGKYSIKVPAGNKITLAANYEENCEVVPTDVLDCGPLGPCVDYILSVSDTGIHTFFTYLDCDANEVDVAVLSGETLEICAIEESVVPDNPAVGSFVLGGYGCNPLPVIDMNVQWHINYGDDGACNKGRSLNLFTSNLGPTVASVEFSVDEVYNVGSCCPKPWSAQNSLTTAARCVNFVAAYGNACVLLDANGTNVDWFLGFYPKLNCNTSGSRTRTFTVPANRIAAYQIYKSYVGTTSIESTFTNIVRFNYIDGSQQLVKLNFLLNSFPAGSVTGGNGDPIVWTTNF